MAGKRTNQGLSSLQPLFTVAVLTIDRDLFRVQHSRLVQPGLNVRQFPPALALRSRLTERDNHMKKIERMRQGRGLLPFCMAAPMFLLTSTAVRAQQTTGVPCSTSTTTTIDGKYIPAPPQSFGGVINLSAVDSKPCWPAKLVPPKGARMSC